MIDFAGRCGLYCGQCQDRVRTKCQGCATSGGRAFWGECRLAACSIARGLRHCGQCSDFPCALLSSFAYDRDHGDDGQRIRNLEAWNEIGLQAWVRQQK